MKAFIGMETSGQMRRRLAAKGVDVISCDILPAEDAGYNREIAADLQVITGKSPAQFLGLDEIRPRNCHIVGDVFEALDELIRGGWIPDLAIFHPTCTYHTVSAAWAFSDPDFDRYPGVGYHQRVKPETLTGERRRQARIAAEADVTRIKFLPIRRKAMENPKGTIPTRTILGQPQQVLQPYEHGDDASKATCLWYFDENGNAPPDMHVPIDPAKRVAGRVVTWGGKQVERWANQTDSGQNNVTPGDDRWKDRSRTYPGISEACIETWFKAVKAA